MGDATLLPDRGTEILIPVCAVIGIAFALVQWLLVAKVRLSNGKDSAGGRSGYTEP
ncbi:UNVERIFIED_CONTAM: Pyrophosphate-energized vacuolar membrane proton pump [Sesamum latifolium]|uniref:Pyrophosphate-energized vacuolar membrane proton pump n=1 Tax=Sesamum latifolium TaxID=2727402 RepID=A0AAW2Y944_9LAMI